MASICIIPARGGSKRIPRKNVKDFLGKPIIAYTIEAAIGSGLFAEVMVSTDDVEIAEIAKKYGAKVPFVRSTENSNDYATTFDVIEEVLQEYQKTGSAFEFTCCIYACAPFVTSNKLIEAFQIMKQNQYDSVFPVMPYSFPIQRALKQQNNKLSFFNPEYSLTRSQDLEKSYHDAGQFYWMENKVIIENKQILTDNSGCVVISELEGQDIDNEMDWKLAELKYELLQSTK
ncbi:pseudaminic acid cytidylyltransferase [Flavobacterium sp.]|uniref:pseudaminic acid cytidylyltransferase n=3 Tax=Flavobacterium sp. TaxID=239 RepID=UPI004047DADC